MPPVVAGVDLGGTTVNLALANPDGSILIEDAIPTDSHLGPERVIDSIGEHLQRLATETESKIVSIGVGVPGLAEIETGFTKFLPNLPTQWRDVPVGPTLSKRFGCPVRLLNDVRAATLAELTFGHGKNIPNVTMAFFSIGTGIGGGIVINGELRLGPLGAAGELGHQTILPDGPRCGCGNLGCLETLSSGPAIAAEGIRLMRMGLAPKLHQLVEGNADRVTTREIATAAKEDKRLAEAVHKSATYLGIAAANVVVVIHPELIVLGGGVSEMGQLLTSRVKEVINERVGMLPTESIRVERSQLGEKAGVMGAFALAAQQFAQNYTPRGQE